MLNLHNVQCKAASKLVSHINQLINMQLLPWNFLTPKACARGRTGVYTNYIVYDFGWFHNCFRYHAMGALVPPLTELANFPKHFSFIIMGKAKTGMLNLPWYYICTWNTSQIESFWKFPHTFSRTQLVLIYIEHIERVYSESFSRIDISLSFSSIFHCE